LPSVGDRSRPAQAPRRNLSLATDGTVRRGPGLPRERSGPAGASSRRPGPRQPRPAGAPSRHYAKHVSALLPEDADTRLNRRHRRYAQRAILWRESRVERIRKCGRVPVGSEGLVAIKANAGVAHYAGLASCGSIWACPVCSAKIRNTRAIEISTAAAVWDLAGNSVYMITLTMPHNFGMRLAKLLPVIADGFRSIISGRAWLRVKKQARVAGTIRSVEVTHGVNSWHPHAHVLVFIEGDPGADGLAVLALHVRERWGRFVVRAGYRSPDDTHGVVIERCISAAQAGAYIAKNQDGRAVGNELARADLKQGRSGHRTPFEILEAFRWTGDAEDLALWHEYERATKGHQAITWSKGLRKLLETPERTDEEIAAEEIGGDVIALIEPRAWREIIAMPGLPAFLLDEAERGGSSAVAIVLARYGVQLEVPP
jgi:hypothetical protein